MLGRRKIKGVRVKLPQFNGYFKLATMSPKEYLNDQQKKALQDIHLRVKIEAVRLMEE